MGYPEVHLVGYPEVHLVIYTLVYTLGIHYLYTPPSRVHCAHGRTPSMSTQATSLFGEGCLGSSWEKGLGESLRDTSFSLRCERERDTLRRVLPLS